jgi:hypothetical protein
MQWILRDPCHNYQAEECINQCSGNQRVWMSFQVPSIQKEDQLLCLFKLFRKNNHSIKNLKTWDQNQGPRLDKVFSNQSFRIIQRVLMFPRNFKEMHMDLSPTEFSALKAKHSFSKWPTMLHPKITSSFQRTILSNTSLAQEMKWWRKPSPQISPTPRQLHQLWLNHMPRIL